MATDRVDVWRRRLKGDHFLVNQILDLVLEIDTVFCIMSNSVGHDTEDCINLKHKIQDLIDQEVVSLQPAAPNININPLPNHGGGNINMIEIDEDERETKRITPVEQEDLEKDVASLSVREKGEFVILTPTKAVALVPSKTLANPKFVIETAVAQGMTRSGRCYTADELSLGGQKKACQETNK